MEGFDVVTSDDHKVGHVVRREGDFLIVEHGTIFKTCHALPETFTHVDESEKVVRTTISKHLLQTSPKISEGTIDRRAVAAHYGLAEGVTAPETGGYGALNADDPALSAEQHAQRLGVPTAPEQRTQSRQAGNASDETFDAVEDREDRPIPYI